MVIETKTMSTTDQSDVQPSTQSGATDNVLEVKNLRVGYHTQRGLVRAVNNVSFFLRRGERLGLVGESGSGKTTTALSLMRLLQDPAEIEGGQVFLDGKDLLTLSREEMRQAMSDPRYSRDGAYVAEVQQRLRISPF